MEFRILGSFDVRSGGRTIPLRGGKRRALLALLVVRRNEIVTFDRLVDELWGEEPPTSARQMVKGYVSDLRRDLAVAGDDTRLTTHSLGYRLEIDPAQVDAEQFERLVARGGEAVAAARFGVASELLRQALTLWRGPALADFMYEAFAENEIRRLEDLRLVALEQRVAADLELGRHLQVLGELEALVRSYPLRERLAELLMLALYRGDRGADALEVYNAIRASLDELGLEPGPPLRLLQQAILRHDPEIRPAGEIVVEPPAAEEPAPEPQPEEPVAVSERRKTVTVLFCDVVDSTGFGRRFDPELVRSVLKRYFTLASRILERHGASVEKFVGDAVMAVFGVPTMHEDDSLRAARAAVELREQVAAFNAELGAGSGIALEIRIGLNTGEVATDEAAAGEPAVTGHAVNLAARLQQSAAVNEILLGETTVELIRGAVKVTPTPALSLKGVGRSVRAFKLQELTAGEPAYARRFDAPLVGREHELAQLRKAFRRCVAGSSTTLFTVLGAAGIGKSRLVAEARLELDAEARVLGGACLPYGEGTTFSPLRQMLVQALGEPLDERLRDVVADDPDREWLLRSVAQLLDLGGDLGGSSLEESFVSVRRVLEQLAFEQPLVLVFEDVHWAEPALLDLIENVGDLARSAPIFLVCVARPELLEQRTTWAGGKPNATTMLLEPLEPGEASRLADWLLRDDGLDAAARAGALERAEGNPLFLEQLCAHAGAKGRRNDERLPQTILALLAARVDRLGPAERAVIEGAAIVGTEFDVTALGELAPAAIRPSLTGRLDSLVRKELVRPMRSQGDGGRRFRFRHVLVRDAVYLLISKSRRMDLHERFADWLDATRSADEYCDELVGHHLEEAHRCRVDLGVLDANTAAVAERASDRLESAARRALVRSDDRAAVALFERAALLVPETVPRRSRLFADVAAAMIECGDLSGAESVLESTMKAATAADPWARSRLLVEQQLLRFFSSQESGTEAATEVAERALATLEAVGDHRGLARAWGLRAVAEWVRGQTAAAAAAWERAADHARLAGEEHEQAKLLAWLTAALWLGPLPVDEAIPRCEQVRAEVHGHLVSEAEVLRPLGALHGQAGRFDVARSLFAESRSLMDKLGPNLNSMLSHHEALTEILAGNYAYAEEHLRSGYEELERVGETSFRSTTAALIARATFARERYEDADFFAGVGAELAQGDDVFTQVLWRGVRARLLALDGAVAEAEEIARESVALAATTDIVNSHAEALTDLAAVLTTAGEHDEASRLLTNASRMYEQKGNHVAARGARAQLASLAAA
jgi:class 3 adenylate cyclase/tetratricopeptide (TPR) repeat protein/DNA-binding winged helix-turn-helix (wHTH) protein